MIKKILKAAMALFLTASLSMAEGTIYVKFDNIGSNEVETTFGEIPFNTKIRYTEYGDGGDSNVGTIAMFLVPVNYTMSGPYTQFELKASTNNFSHGVSEDVRLQFYAQSEIADRGGKPYTNSVAPHYNTTYDKMWIFACTYHSTEDVRSYTFIENTMPGYGWTNTMTTVCVLVDTSCLRRHYEDGGAWLSEDNQDLMWCWHRYRYNNNSYERENEYDGHGLWRPIAPIRWFTKMPSWAESQISSQQ